MKPIAAAFMASLVLAGPAFAGAPTLEKRHGQIITTATFVTGDQYFDASGKLLPVADYRKFELTTLLEYGLMDGLTLIAQPSLVSSSLSGPGGGDHTGLGHSEAGARVRLFQRGPNTLSLQASILSPGLPGGAGARRFGLNDTQADVRLLYLRSISLGKWPGFIDVQSGYRLRSGRTPDEVRLDVSFGICPMPKVLVLSQSFNTVTTSSTIPGTLAVAHHKFQTSIVYDVTNAWSLQVGGMTTIAGANALREHGLILGLWRRF